MDQQTSAANSNWCGECHQHKAICTCDPKSHIFLVEYRLVIDTGMQPHWCDEKVRVVAYDQYLAISKVHNWALTTEFIWWTENGEATEHRVPIGARDVTITKVELYAADVGEMLKLCPLPDIFPHEE